MAPTTSSNTKPVSFPPDPASSKGREELVYGPSYGVAEPVDELEARTHQLSLLVEVNAALAGALDVESVLGVDSVAIG